MKKILGLDLGTNSIGWAIIDQDFENKHGFIHGIGSRIIPMTQDVLGKFDSGVSISQTAERTGYRGVRRLRERHLLRRERLHRVLNLLNFLPPFYASQIDFKKRLGQFKSNTEPKLVYNETNQFIFKNSFNEMVVEFKKTQPHLFENDKLIPYDWTIYYLRKKALTEKIEKEELAWLLLNFNQKRGYFQLRGEEEEETPNKKVEFHSLKVVDVTADEPQKGKTDIWYNVILENSWIYRRASKFPLFDWIAKTKEFVVTTDLNDDGSEKTDKDGKIKRSFRAPAETDWTLVKTKTEQTIYKSGKTVGQYIYDTLLENPTQKINGKLVRVIERKFYKNELEQILKTQQQFHTELKNAELYNTCIEELYEQNEAHRNNISKRDFVHLFLNDIIFYQRPLKSKKSLISDCKFESRRFIKDGLTQNEALKCISKSHPLFQEFRLWQWIQNLHIFEKENNDIPITEQFLNSEDDKVKLFEFLNDKKEIEQEGLIKFLLTPLKLKPKELKIEVAKYRWNFVEDKAYPCNETRALMITKLSKCNIIATDFLSKEIEEALWHILYSVNDKEEVKSALEKFALKHQLGNDFVEQFMKYPPYKNEYGSYSAKAIKKLLPLMRMGKYWNEETIHPQTKSRIEKIINGEFDESIKDRVRNKAFKLNEINHFRALPLWLVSYIVYDRHAEDSNIEKWKTPEDVEDYLKSFKQHSLRNPIVEQVITETLRVVKDIWKHYGNGKENFFDEIHIELGREMKNPADKRKKMTENITTNENTNLRIKALLAEMINYKEVENVRPYSPTQVEILKIYEDGVLNSGIEIEDDILKISKTAQPSKADLLRYKLWLEQKYRSPYTGEIIPLNKLFTPAYEIEHIIPQSRYFDDSFSNKVICESEVNKDKDNLLAFEYITANEGKKIELSGGKFTTLFTAEQFEHFIKNNYAKNYSKGKKLMLLEIPEKMIERQMNDTRYISKEVKNLLSKVVRLQQNDEGTTANNLLSTNGQITTALKQDWGLNEIWNELIAPRFVRLNEMTNSKNYGDINPNTNKFLPTVPLEQQKGFNKKRIDHRHHALDALVIACASRNHINYLNNQNALDKDKKKGKETREDLKRTLCIKKYNADSEKNYRWVFKQPWETFIKDAKDSLDTTIISFKQNLRVINKTVNKYQHWENVHGKMEKVIAIQTKGDSWAIRKPLHKDTVSGIINLPRIKVAKDKILTATRKNLDTSFDLKTIASITDTGIQKILTNYLKLKENNPEIAFTTEGIEEMNNNILNYNDGKTHKPIFKVRVFEQGSKFVVGHHGNKKDKFVEGAKGTNLFFAIYKDDKGKRNYTTIPFNEVVESQKQSAALKQKPQSVPLKNNKGDDLVFHLSPNDLVYVPTQDEIENPSIVDFNKLNKEQVNRIYKCVSFSGIQCFFIKSEVATSIVNKVEYTSLNKIENAIDGTQIKACCWKLEIDRLGNINNFIN
jgi:CRISPR-associated endonuclease Csn1